MVHDGVRKGPFTINQMQRMWQAGTLTGKTLHFMDGYTEWLPLSYIQDDLEPPTPTPPLLPAKAGAVLAKPGKVLSRSGKKIDRKGLLIAIGAVTILISGFMILFSGSSGSRYVEKTEGLTASDLLAVDDISFRDVFNELRRVVMEQGGDASMESRNCVKIHWLHSIPPGGARKMAQIAQEKLGDDVDVFIIGPSGFEEYRANAITSPSQKKALAEAACATANRLKSGGWKAFPVSYQSVCIAMPVDTREIEARETALKAKLLADRGIKIIVTTPMGQELAREP